VNAYIHVTAVELCNSANADAVAASDCLRPWTWYTQAPSTVLASLWCPLCSECVCAGDTSTVHVITSRPTTVIYIHYIVQLLSHNILAQYRLVVHCLYGQWPISRWLTGLRLATNSKHVKNRQKDQLAVVGRRTSSWAIVSPSHVHKTQLGWVDLNRVVSVDIHWADNNYIFLF